VKTIASSSHAPGTGKAAPNFRAAGVLFAVLSEMIEDGVVTFKCRTWLSRATSIQLFRRINSYISQRFANSNAPLFTVASSV
jgi:hypothetical protein